VLYRSLLLNTVDRTQVDQLDQDFRRPGARAAYNVRLISVRLPRSNSQNEVLLDMVVGAKEPEAIIGFIRKAGGILAVRIASVPVTLPPSQNEPLHRFRVSVNYAQKTLNARCPGSRPRGANPRFVMRALLGVLVGANLMAAGLVMWPSADRPKIGARARASLGAGA